MMKRIKVVPLLSSYAVALFAFGCGADAQVYSTNVVGYTAVPISKGDNLIANQFDNGRANTLNELFPTSDKSIPDGTTFTEWDPLTQMYLPLSTYDSSSGWSINYDFNTFSSGAGGLLNSASVWTNVFQGSVSSYSNITPEFGGPIWNPNYASGKYLIACPEPMSSTMDSMFAYVVGRPPQDGESVQILNASTQTYTTTTFHTGTGWDNGDPSLYVADAAWFNLVPEPSSIALIGFGPVVLALWRRKRASRIIRKNSLTE